MAQVHEVHKSTVTQIADLPVATEDLGLIHVIWEATPRGAWHVPEPGLENPKSARILG